MATMTESEVYEKFAAIVSRSLRIDPARVTPDAHLMDDLGAESLDLIEITMEVESEFNVWMPEKSILDTAIEVFGPGVLEQDGYLTETGKHLLRCRLPEAANSFADRPAVKDVQSCFLTVRSWVALLSHLVQHTPSSCEQCSSELVPEMNFRMKCPNCGLQVPLRSGEDLNREWVQEFYEKEYKPGSNVTAAQN
jgi:acyl carrier protein